MSDPMSAVVPVLSYDSSGAPAGARRRRVTQAGIGSVLAIASVAVAKPLVTSCCTQVAQVVRGPRPRPVPRPLTAGEAAGIVATLAPGRITPAQAGALRGRLQRPGQLYVATPPAGGPSSDVWVNDVGGGCVTVNGISGGDWAQLTLDPAGRLTREVLCRGDSAGVTTTVTDASGQQTTRRIQPGRSSPALRLTVAVAAAVSAAAEAASGLVLLTFAVRMVRRPTDARPWLIRCATANGAIAAVTAVTVAGLIFTERPVLAFVGRSPAAGACVGVSVASVAYSAVLLWAVRRRAAARL